MQRLRSYWLVSASRVTRPVLVGLDREQVATVQIVSKKRRIGRWIEVGARALHGDDVALRVVRQRRDEVQSGLAIRSIQSSSWISHIVHWPSANAAILPAGR
jgi:hypothetical protein